MNGTGFPEVTDYYQESCFLVYVNKSEINILAVNKNLQDNSNM